MPVEVIRRKDGNFSRQELLQDFLDRPEFDKWSKRDKFEELEWKQKKFSVLKDVLMTGVKLVERHSEKFKMRFEG